MGSPETEPTILSFLPALSQSPSFVHSIRVVSKKSLKHFKKE
jgi:hypothetical protein